jgi:hypothetical protein
MIRAVFVGDKETAVIDPGPEFDKDTEATSGLAPWTLYLLSPLSPHRGDRDISDSMCRGRDTTGPSNLDFGFLGRIFKKSGTL